MATKTRTHSIRFYIQLALAGLVLSACGDSKVDVQNEDQEIGFRRGKSLLKEGRNPEALNAFLKIIEKRKQAPESHMEAGILYLDHLQDPISAIYHFRKFLELRKEGEQSEVVRQLIDTGMKKLAAQLPAQPYGDGITRVDLLEQVGKLKKENLILKEQLIEIKNQYDQVRAALRTEREFTTASSNNPALPAQSVQRRTNQTRTQSRPVRQAPSQKTYVVKSGDTLSKISRMVYGTPGRWREIYAANRDVIRDPGNVPLGAKLKIPQ